LYIERVTGIGGIFLRSAQLERLRAWYAELTWLWEPSASA